MSKINKFVKLFLIGLFIGAVCALGANFLSTSNTQKEYLPTILVDENFVDVSERETITTPVGPLDAKCYEEAERLSDVYASEGKTRDQLLSEGMTEEEALEYSIKEALNEVDLSNLNSYYDDCIDKIQNGIN